MRAGALPGTNRGPGRPIRRPNNWPYSFSAKTGTILLAFKGITIPEGLFRNVWAAQQADAAPVELRAPNLGEAKMLRSGAGHRNSQSPFTWAKPLGPMSMGSTFVGLWKGPSVDNGGLPTLVARAYR